MNTFESLISHNEKEFAAFKQRPFFSLLKEQNAMDDVQKNKFLNCVQVFSNEFQKILFARQATCVNDKFSPTFARHLSEELGHDEMLAQRKQEIIIENDSILKASSSWFVLQMFIRDNIEKTVLVHLVLELSGDFYHDLAKNIFNEEVSSEYFNIHAELDEFHANMGVDLLDELNANDYQYLHEVSSQGWQMLKVMIDRTYQLVMEPGNG